MYIEINDLKKVKYPEQFKYKVYNVTCKRYYSGQAKIAAINADEANKVIEKFKENDPKNQRDSFGWEYVTEVNCNEMVSDESGILANDIFYTGY